MHFTLKEQHRDVACLNQQVNDCPLNVISFVTVTHEQTFKRHSLTGSPFARRINPFSYLTKPESENECGGSSPTVCVHSDHEVISHCLGLPELVGVAIVHHVVAVRT